MQKIPSLKKVIVLVTERSEDTGLALFCGEAGRKVEVYHERLFLF